MPYSTLSFRMTLSDLAKCSMTRSIARPLCEQSYLFYFLLVLLTFCFVSHGTLSWLIITLNTAHCIVSYCITYWIWLSHSVCRCCSYAGWYSASKTNTSSHCRTASCADNGNTASYNTIQTTVNTAQCIQGKYPIWFFKNSQLFNCFSTILFHTNLVSCHYKSKGNKLVLSILDVEWQYYNIKNVNK